ncbi:MAG: ATPase [Rhodospirillaceae bacterium]|jgi:chaperone required for assembly of F1-ATPase|nr:ATPase [Rhodospirillaceae bacterium]|tara:strand:- start:6410 stop:7126 length:717 start_codon:yes stop_codon:yes gene_type:complete
MPWGNAKRFYKEAGYKAAGGGFALTLDGRPANTPEGNPLVLVSERLARAVAREWAGQDGDIRAESMPITGLACTAIDRVKNGRGAIIDHTLKYAPTDLLCYRADEPQELKRHQQARWQPLLDWAAEKFGARLAATEGIVPRDQPRAALENLRRAVEALDDLQLTAVAAVTQASGSLIIGLALVHGHITAGEAAAASQLDETWHNEKWGGDPEQAGRLEALKMEIAAAAALVELTDDFI